jgi:hypothetical protein
MVLLLAVVLSVLLWDDFLPGKILFSNDGPLGRLISECHRLPARFTGCWEDLNMLGSRDWGSSPSLSYGLLYLVKPYLFSKLYVPVALLILGLGAWCFFRQSGLTPAACLLGGLAAALGSSFFSAACWGVASHPICVGMIFFALAALVDTSARARWLRVALAGLAVGMAVTEGADIGALLSVYAGLFVLYQAWIADGSRAKNVAAGAGRVGLMAVCAALLAAEAISGLLATEVKGMTETQQNAQTQQEHWDWATQWSLPKRETLSLLVSGLFGYRMDTPGGGEYWGAVGRAPVWDRYFANGREGPPPEQLLRFSGGGSYIGVLVVLVAIWAAVQSLRRKDSAFRLSERRWLWFWLGASLTSLLLAYGRFAPFYQVVYALPYFSTIRNPVKFLNMFAFAQVVLFAYGVDGLWRRYMQPDGAGTASQWSGLKQWWARAPRFDKGWTLGCAVALGAVLLAWLAYASSRSSLEQYLQTVLFDQARAHAIAGFSIGQVRWFVLFFVLAGGGIILILSGAFAGARARWGAVLLGLVLVADLGLANQPWIVYWDHRAKYASNPILDALREKPYEHRVTILPSGTSPQFVWLSRVYTKAWLNHQFPYYNIQSLDPVQISRMPADLEAYEDAFNTTNQADYLRIAIRTWQLSNTRYLIGEAAESEDMNRQTDPAHPPFRIAERFNLAPRPGVTRVTGEADLTAVPDAKGTFALIEFTGALPRAKLYSNWQVVTNDEAVLGHLGDAAFDPERTVFVAGRVPAAPLAATTNDNNGSVEFSGYAPKHIVLKCDAPAPSVLMLNDRFDPNWHVKVDGKPEALLHCNYIMRGVYLAPGAHTVEFRFQPPVGPLYVTLAAIGVGLVALGFVIVTGRRSTSPAPSVPSPALPQPSAEPTPTPDSGALRPGLGGTR